MFATSRTASSEVDIETPSALMSKDSHTVLRCLNHDGFAPELAAPDLSSSVIYSTGLMQEPYRCRPLLLDGGNDMSRKKESPTGEYLSPLQFAETLDLCQIPQPVAVRRDVGSMPGDDLSADRPWRASSRSRWPSSSAPAQSARFASGGK